MLRLQIMLACKALLGTTMALAMSTPSIAATIGSNYVTGTVTDVMGNINGLMVRIEYGASVPTDCANPPYGWMQISRSYPEMSSVVLSHWMTERKMMTIYTGASNGTACSVTGVTPVN